LAAQLGALLCLDLLFGQDGCEIFHLKDLAGFDFVVAGAAVGATLDPLDGLFKGLDLQDRETGDELLGFGEGAVDDGARLAGELDACAFGAGMEAIAKQLLYMFWEALRTPLGSQVGIAAPSRVLRSCAVAYCCWS